VLLLDARPLAQALTRARLVPLGLRVLDDAGTFDGPCDAVIAHADCAAAVEARRAAGCRAPVLWLSDAAAPPAGTDATVLPATPSRRALLAALAAALARPTESGGPMRVLSAEDNRTNQLVFAKMVRDLDIELRFANDGFEAVEAYRGFRPDLVFMDISMPGMDGRAATRAIRALEADEGAAPVPIVALTAHALEGDREDILAAGLDGYISKPLRRAAIHDTIRQHLPPGRRPLLADATDTPAA